LFLDRLGRFAVGQALVGHRAEGGGGVPAGAADGAGEAIKVAGGVGLVAVPILMAVWPRRRPTHHLELSP